MSTLGRYHDASGDTSGDTLSTLGDTLSTSRDNKSTSEDNISTSRGYHEHIGGIP